MITTIFAFQWRNKRQETTYLPFKEQKPRMVFKNCHAIVLEDILRTRPFSRGDSYLLKRENTEAKSYWERRKVSKNMLLFL